jgi:polar amino acid transport system substrate-binding protein
MKKLLALILAAAMLLALAACAAKETPTTETETANETPAEAPADTAGDDAQTSDMENIISKGKMVVGITDYDPMNYRDENGEWTGFDTELTIAVCEKLGIEPEFIEISWDNKEFELDSGSIDCVWNGMTLTDGVKEAMETTAAYLVNNQVIVMDENEVGNYTDVGSMKGLTFACEAGSAGEAALMEADLQYTAVSSQANALLEVKSGSVDACVIDSIMAGAVTGEGTSYSELGAGYSFATEEFGIGFRKGSDMASKVDEIIAELRADGTVQALAEKYELTGGLVD